MNLSSPSRPRGRCPIARLLARSAISVVVLGLVVALLVYAASARDSCIHMSQEIDG